VSLSPGHPQGSHTVRTARQLILDNFNKARKDLKKTEKENENENDSKRSMPLKKVEKRNIQVDDVNIEFSDKSVQESNTAVAKAATDDMVMVR
jgi:hypothetical protein